MRLTLTRAQYRKLLRLCLTGDERTSISAFATYAVRRHLED